MPDPNFRIERVLDVTRIRIRIHGTVQGVGFRPFIYRLAGEMGVTGWVSNTRQGVVIEAEGPEHHLEAFMIRIKHQHPPEASISQLEHLPQGPTGSHRFEIRESHDTGLRRAVILPDLATCNECLTEIFDPANRRYLYPFTSCTHCGPRFTILESVPYDRANTTMQGFEMCADCRHEYENPLDRRFHAQLNACSACGPHVELWDSAGSALATRHDAISSAVEALKSGRIVAVEGLGGFHLMVDATNEDAVRHLRGRKHRPEKPFAVMAPSLEWILGACEVNSNEERLLCSPESPIVLLRSRHANPAIAPRNPYLGVMLPFTPLHHILMKAIERPVAATSGNPLGNIADVLLVHNLPIRHHVEDSISRVILGRLQILRRARGYAPLPITMKGSCSLTIGSGTHLNNTAALAVPAENDRETQVFISQDIEDLQRLYDVPAEIVAHDGFDHEFGVQHHWAHVMACMAEHGLEAPALGVAWDGTGGEFLLATGDTFRRAAHFRTFPLPGGDAAARKPGQTALGLLYEIFPEQIFDGMEHRVLRQILTKNVRLPLTSSVGRLFDAVASITGIRGEASFEGQAAMELEFAADRQTDEFYPYAIRPEESLIVDWEPMVRTILADVRERVATGLIATRFHNTLAEIIVDIAERIGESRVLLTGGCFQNRYLTERAVRRLTEGGFSTYWHERVAPNDGGISLGQVAAARLEDRKCVSQST